MASVMKTRSSAFLIASIAAMAGCSSAGGEDGRFIETEQDPRAFTVSHRNKVRLPPSELALSAQGFARQVQARDPVSPIRCGTTDDSPAYRELASFLGGIAWSHPVALLKDMSLPPLYAGEPPPPSENAPEASRAGDASSGAAPVIERPDLVGIQDGIAIFLSRQHGLLAVDTRSGTPTLSCSMKLPGEPKNFLFRGSEIVVVVNARNGFNRSALLRYSIAGGTFAFVDGIRLDDQTITDARLFDATIVAYTSWSKTRPEPVAPPDEPRPLPAVSAPSGGRGGGVSAAMADPASTGGATQDRIGAKVLVVQWDDKLQIDWEDALLDDPVRQDPLEGSDRTKTYTAGQLIAEHKTYSSFVAASDRYIAVPRTVQKTRFTKYEMYSYQACTSYNPRAFQVTQCHVNYERRANPDYRAPSPTTGDYACNGKKLADCIQAAAPTVSQYIYAPVSQTCDKVWEGRCEKYETISNTYPRFETETETELTIYRFENGTFTKLDSTLAKMVATAGGSDAIKFEMSPLSVKGAVENRNQIQFQNGHLYVYADQALQTLAVAASSISYLDRLDNPGRGTSNGSAIVFSTDRAMISSSVYDFNNARRSQVTMLDLTTPSKPTKLNAFEMPGETSQLILAPGGILGPGTVAMGNAQVNRTLQKLTLFSREQGSELDNLLLGTEYDAFSSSWLDASDDQKIRLGAGGQRLFLPYSGRHHADDYEPIAHRLSITRIENARLVSERTFDTSDDIIRTAPVDDDHSVVFGNSATYYVDRTGGEWKMSTLREVFVPFATYRLDDLDLHARISRVGSKCRVTTHAGDARIFVDGELATADVACSESGMPVGYGPNVLFAETRTGLGISPDGRNLTPLPTDVVAAMLEKLSNRRDYCWIDGGPANASTVEYLDIIPGRIRCRTWAAPAR